MTYVTNRRISGIYGCLCYEKKSIAIQLIASYYCRMKSSFTFLIIASLLVTTAAHLVVQLSFVLNQEYLAEEMCESKADATAMCEASCQLSLQMNEVNGTSEGKRANKKQTHSQEELLLKINFADLSTAHRVKDAYCLLCRHQLMEYPLDGFRFAAIKPPQS